MKWNHLELGRTQNKVKSDLWILIANDFICSPLAGPPPAADKCRLYNHVNRFMTRVHINDNETFAAAVYLRMQPLLSIALPYWTGQSILGAYGLKFDSDRGVRPSHALSFRIPIQTIKPQMDMGQSLVSSLRRHTVAYSKGPPKCEINTWPFTVVPSTPEEKNKI